MSNDFIMTFYTLQRACMSWAERMFGKTVMRGPVERSMRTLEEAIELAQAEGVHEGRVRQLVARVYSRPQGEVKQELAGTAIGLLLHAQTRGFNLGDLVDAELMRVNAIDPMLVRVKQQAKADAGLSEQIDWREVGLDLAHVRAHAMMQAHPDHELGLNPDAD
jgi:hypothetical protein